jgi:peptidoglycan/LPS O-acetylase OafA/YrhL
LMVWIPIAYEFTAGCCLYAGWRWLGDRRIGAGWDVVAVLSVAGVFAVLAVTGGEGSRALVTFPLIALFVLACAGADGPVGRILGSRVLRWGGRVSYSVYMTHFIVLMVLGVLLPVEGFAGAGAGTRLGILALYYAAAVAAGAVCYHAVEEPARRWIRDRLRGGRASSDATS